jgi:hypothetical protein
MYSDRVYGIPPEQIVGSAGATNFTYDKKGNPVLMKLPKLLLNDNNAGKPRASISSSGGAQLAHLATRSVTGRCWSTPRRATARG